MSTVGAAVVLGLVVVALLKWNVVRPVAALLCVLFGLVLGATPIGDTVGRILSQIGGWLSGQVGAL